MFAKDCESYKKGQLRIIEINTGKVLGPFDNVNHFYESKEGDFLFAKDCDKYSKGQLRIIDMSSGNYHTFDNVYDYNESKGGDFLFDKDCYSKGQLRIIDMSSGNYHTFDNVYDYNESKGGDFLFAKDCYSKGNLRIIDIKTMKVLGAFDNVCQYEESKGGAFLFAKDCKADEKGQLRIIDIKTMKVLGAFDNVGDYEELKGGDFLFAKDCEEDTKGQLRIIDIKTMKVLGAFDNVSQYTASKVGDFLFAKGCKADEKGQLLIIDMNSGRILCKLSAIIDHTYFITALKEILLSIVHSNGKLSLWKVKQDKATLLFKIGAPELALQGANFADVQGLRNTDIRLLVQHGAIQPTASNTKGEVKAISLDRLSTHLYKEGFSTSDTHNFFAWLTQEAFDSEGLLMDMGQAKNSNIFHFNANIYESIAGLLIPPKALIYSHTNANQLAHSIQDGHLPFSTTNIPAMPNLHPSGPIPTPANGRCLYSSLLLTYLLPVTDDDDLFNKRYLYALGHQPSNVPTSQAFIQLTSDLAGLWSTTFQQIVDAFMSHMQINTTSAVWGGTLEMQQIASRLGVNIQVYTPDPQDASNLIHDPLITPQKGRSNTTLSIIQDTPTPQEANNPHQDSIAHQISTLEPNQHRHHYRAYLPSLSSTNNQAHKPIQGKRISAKLTQSIKETYYQSEWDDQKEEKKEDE